MRVTVARRLPESPAVTSCVVLVHQRFDHRRSSRREERQRRVLRSYELLTIKLLFNGGVSQHIRERERHNKRIFIMICKGWITISQSWVPNPQPQNRTQERLAPSDFESSPAKEPPRTLDNNPEGRSSPSEYHRMD